MKFRNRSARLSSASSVYKTKAWGIENQPDFLNQVLEVESDLYPLEILDCILGIEESLGRVRDIKWSSRVIDIDILYYGSEIVTEPKLTIPHPQIQNRNFTLVPLCEIAPEFVHPILGITQKSAPGKYF
ncbi:MAG: 2-amino-4-hydroxy-6-hydroxymethyldihydropteridine diphosphokinase [Cyclobacteriaceae bacterium]|nr:2-amino-4-hydroxy-6-hydroxymethyldihydropteridine diphosphokinase [Cyclobacteriaceae bacterium]